MDVEFLVDVLPQLIVDFLPPMEVLQTVVNEFISPHQSRPELAAMVMAEVSSTILIAQLQYYNHEAQCKQAFNLLLAQDKQEAITDWVLLCLENFIYQYVTWQCSLLVMLMSCVML